MANKVIIGILVFLVILSGSIGYYSYTLNLQLDSLSGQLSSFQAEQAAQVANLSSELTNLRGETLNRIDNLKEEIAETSADIGTLEDTLEDEVDKTNSRVNTLEDEISESSAKIDTLEDKLGDVATEFSQSAVNASEIYQRVSQTTVRISNGERTIGSGFILDNEAHVMTAHHVIENLQITYVILPDGRVSTATRTGSCRHSDVAVLNIGDELDIEAPPIADSAEVRIGEPVAVVGNPFDLTEALTTGIVSQMNRFVEITHDSQTRWVANLIQFDAAANPGNSGGPLFNSAGEVIGMVIARVDPNEGDGIYYAVSSNKFKRVAASLISKGSFDYPRLGITVSNLTPQQVKDRGLDTANGVLVQGVLADSPARAAGIEVDDVIVVIDGQGIKDVAELISYLGEHKSPGDTTTIELIRGSTRLDFSFNVGTMP